jgi:hypothetical protein
MKTKMAWVVLGISAITDGVITGGTALMSAMVAGGNTGMPTKAVIVLACVGAMVQAARTVQQALKGAMQNLVSVVAPPQA